MAITTKGMKNPAEKLQVLAALDLVPLIDPIELETREAGDDHDVVVFRTKLSGLLSTYGEELIAIAEMDDTEAPEAVRNEADALLSSAMPLVLRFLSDRRPEVPTAISQCVSDLLRTVS
jgi:exportin-T